MPPSAPPPAPVASAPPDGPPSALPFDDLAPFRLLSPRERARPFFADGDDGDGRAVLLLHGFTGSPFEMRLLGEHLARRGYAVSVPNLAGHDGTAGALAATTFHDWQASASAALDDLRARAPRARVAVCGLSMGALLTIELARRRPDDLSAVVLLATALTLRPWLMRLLRWAARTRLVPRTVPRWVASDVFEREPRALNPALDAVPLSAVYSLLDLMTRTAGALASVAHPAFVAHGRHDRVIPIASMDLLIRSLPNAVESLTLERSRHLITLDRERAHLFDRIDAFLSRHLA